MNEQAPLIFGVVSQEAAALILSVAVAAGLGWWTLWSQRDIARARLTFETLDRKNWDQDFIEQRVQFGRLRHAKDIARYADPGKWPPEERNKFQEGIKSIQAILNDYENIAIGIRRGILDEEFLFRYMQSGLIRDWEAASPYVIELRNLSHIPHVYVEFEGLAAQWQNNMSYHRTDQPMPHRRRVVSIK
ncbi:MAG: DUF4760 domain-containing protein [Methyloceanibacter sp.]|uniref:DUF4760 domain-containing protein n=1 Tax=Methyloceanibacter sp. TaxID=1965321 RepID=UPI003D6CB153